MQPPVSIVIVSRHRPEALARCLTGVAQLDYPEFEVIVVACPAGLATVAAHPEADSIKTVAFDEANISAARNLGIAEAAGEVVAFLDDDAVPEPLWLFHLAGAFASEEVAAAGGYVLGRNGLSFQWKTRTVDGTGTAIPLEVDDTRPTVLHPANGRAIKTEGTNMAVRREVLAQMGGFDPAFRFYLDETDLNMRLARAGHATAVVPLAQVHHGFAASSRRAADRTPRDLTEIGASQQVFLRKHLIRAARGPAWDSFVAGQRLRLLRLMQRGPLQPDDVTRLMRGLLKGGRDGVAREADHTPPIPRARDGFRAFPGRPAAPRRLIAGRLRHAARLRTEAAEAVRAGQIVTLILLDPSARYHRVRFTGSGIWEQSGGLFGRSLRDAPLFQPWRFASRFDAEARRVAAVRGPFGDTFKQ